MSITDCIIRDAYLLTRDEKLAILKLVVDDSSFEEQKHILKTSNGEPNIDLDSLAIHAPKILKEISMIVKGRLEFLNTYKKPDYMEPKVTYLQPQI